jgi:hypothetical protein
MTAEKPRPRALRGRYLDQDDLNENGYWEHVDYYDAAAVCRICGALVAMDEEGGWAETHVAWHVSHELL